MKKTYALVLGLAISLTALVGCGSKAADTSANTNTNTNTEKTAAAFKDGEYKGTYDKMDSHGWKPQIDIKIEGGKITKVDFDNVNKDGKLKSQDEAYEASMKKAKNIGPKEYTPKLDQQLVDSQDAEKIDGVTGATSSSNEFKALSKAVLEKAKTGDKSDTVLTMVEEKK